MSIIHLNLRLKYRLRFVSPSKSNVIQCGVCDQGEVAVQRRSQPRYLRSRYIRAPAVTFRWCDDPNEWPHSMRHSQLYGIARELIFAISRLSMPPSMCLYLCYAWQNERAGRFSRFISLSSVACQPYWASLGRDDTGLGFSVFLVLKHVNQALFCEEPVSALLLWRISYTIDMACIRSRTPLPWYLLKLIFQFITCKMLYHAHFQ